MSAVLHPTWQQALALILLAALISSVVFSIVSTVRDRRTERRTAGGGAR
jgi:hypothetical protein